MHCEEVENNGVWERVLHKPETEGEEIEENEKLLELFSVYVLSEMIALLVSSYCCATLMYSRKSLVKTSYTSVMIYHRGASLSKQHTGFTNWSLYKTGFVTHK